jgi:hypothetical protein
MRTVSVRFEIFLMLTWFFTVNSSPEEVNITDILLLDVLWVLLLKALRVLVDDVSRFVAHCFVRSETFCCLMSCEFFKFDSS